MQIHWILLSTFLFTLSLPRQAEKPDEVSSHSVTIFEKTFPHDKNKKLMVTCEEVPFTPQGLAEIAQLRKTLPPGTGIPDHRYAYSYFTVTQGTQRKLLWTEYLQVFGSIEPGKASDGSMGMAVFDVALQDNMLWVLYKKGHSIEVNTIRLNQRRAASSTSVKQVATLAGETGTPSPIGPGRVLEHAGPFDGVNGGCILEPILNGEVTVKLTHYVMQDDGSPRITTYHLARDADRKEFWMSDPRNIYRTAEKTGLQLLNEHR